MSYRAGKVLCCALLLLLPAAMRAQSASGRGRTEAEVLLRSAQLAAQFHSGELAADADLRLPYRYFAPNGEAADGTIPVVLYLHGETEAGTDNEAQLTKTENATVWMEPDHLLEHPVYVVAPQLPRGEVWTSARATAATLALLDRFFKLHPHADAKRLYLLGFSMGATGAYHLLLQHPGMFASAMVISGSADAYLADAKGWAALRNTPVIIVHSYDDAVVPVSAALNAAAALQAGGNHFLGYGAPTPALWSPGSVASPHDAWYTAFEKFEVLYNSLFLGDLRHSEEDPTTIYTSRRLGDGMTQVWDYALGTCIVIERGDKAVLIDATMGRGSIYQYVREHVLVNKDVPIEIFVTHQHQDHVLGLKSFVGAAQLKSVYVQKADSAPILALLGPDAGKVRLVSDGDLVPLGGSSVEVIGVPGHTAGSIVMKYGKFLLSGDSIGTGYVGVGALSVEQYRGSVQHLLARMGAGRYTIYGGHTGELRGKMTEQYVHDLLACVDGIVSGSVESATYWRARDAGTRRVSTVGAASVTYVLPTVRRIAAALSGLHTSEGLLYPAYLPEFVATTANTPGFQAYLSYYDVWVNESAQSIDVTASVLDGDYKRLTIDGANVTSGQPKALMLTGKSNPFSIEVTAADGQRRRYTITVIRGKP